MNKLKFKTLGKLHISLEESSRFDVILVCQLYVILSLHWEKVSYTRSIWEIPAWEKGWFPHYEHSHFDMIPSFWREFLRFSHTQEGIVPRGNVVNPPCDICDIIVLNKLTVTQSKCICVGLEESMKCASNQWRKTKRSQPVTGWTWKQ